MFFINFLYFYNIVKYFNFCMESRSTIKFNKHFHFAKSRITLTNNKDDITESPKTHQYEASVPSTSLMRNVIKGNTFMNKRSKTNTR